MKVIAVLGAGIGGQVISESLSREYPNDKVILIGKKVNSSFGLFYLNKEIPGITGKSFKVEYCKLGDGTFDDYQKKSRGESINSIKTSSFDKVGNFENGYLLNKDFGKSKHYTSVEGNAVKVNLSSQSIDTDDEWHTRVNYDELISTVPLKVFLQITNLTGIDPSEFKYQKVYEKVTPPWLVGKFEDTFDSMKVFYDTTDSIYYRHNSYYKGDNLVKMTSESIIEDDSATSVHPYGKIIPSEKINNYVNQLEEFYPNVKLCGRYSRWDYHYLITDSYVDAKKFIKSRRNSIY